MKAEIEYIYGLYAYFKSYKAVVSFPEYITAITKTKPLNSFNRFIKKYAVRKNNDGIS